MYRYVTLLGVLLCASNVLSSESLTKPHIFFVLVDDLGWAEVGFNRDNPTKEVVTPTLDALVASGIHLRRQYVHPMCTPTRTSVQSGRLPVHVSTKLLTPENPNCGIPRNMTGFAQKLKEAGYRTHQVGKWDAGMATPKHTPHGRGYDTSLNYFTHKNDFWTQREMQSHCPKSKHSKFGSDIIDLWHTDQPAKDLNGTAFEEFLFNNEILSIINDHPVTDPLLMFYTPHIAHCPLQLPKSYLDRFDFLNDESACHAQTEYIYPGQAKNFTYKCRQTYHASVYMLDEAINNITTLLKTRGMWENTLMVFSSDNGGPIHLAESGANNHPLRGGKYSVLEGGVRAAAFLSGGFLPKEVRGSSIDQIVHIADYYTTFSILAGVDPVDHEAAKWGLPPVDGLDMWPLFSGQNKTSPRIEVPIGKNTLIYGDLKLMVGTITEAGWEGPHYPNATSGDHEVTSIKMECGTPSPNGTGGCLFNVSVDMTEHDNIAAAHPDIVQFLYNRLQTLKKGFWENSEKGIDACPKNITIPCGCWMANAKYGGFFGPYQEVTLDGTSSLPASSFL